MIDIGVMEALGIEPTSMQVQMALGPASRTLLSRSGLCCPYGVSGLDPTLQAAAQTLCGWHGRRPKVRLQEEEIETTEVLVEKVAAELPQHPPTVHTLQAVSASREQ